MARVRERHTKPHDCNYARSSSDRRSETRSLRLISMLRINSGTDKQKDRPKAVLKSQLSGP